MRKEEENQEEGTQTPKPGPGVIDLASAHPELASEWRAPKPSDYIRRAVVERKDGPKPGPGVIDLASAHPELASEWRAPKNGNL